MSNIALEPATVQSVAACPVSARHTYSDGCRNCRAAANTAGSCSRIQPILAAVWKAAGTCPVRACRFRSPNRSRSAAAAAVARLSR